MADNASLARPYAKAVFSLADESGAHEAWSSVLTQLSTVSQDGDFASLISDPRIDGAQLTKLLTELAGEHAPAGTENFINLLVTNGRVDALADIEQQFTELVAKAKAQVNAQVISAMALSDEQKASISAALETRLGLKVNLEETVDADLIGGAVIKAGDLVIDGSAKGRLEKLTSVLMR